MDNDKIKIFSTRTNACTNLNQLKPKTQSDKAPEDDIKMINHMCSNYINNESDIIITSSYQVLIDLHHHQ